ncbi:MAG TPA: DUF488 domain-containing protein [Candidatus Limnocylindria bacterium]|nr:DUF488 domain-containing protein [Candidatus Limnocylindria bacterium]
MRIWTIGHGTRSIEELTLVLREARVVTLVDVRTFPGSRRHPQFGKDALRAALTEAGIAYMHLPGLGGRRDPHPGSPHTALRVEAFRGYADHMSTPEFQADLARLQAVAAATSTAYMCAETLWWRCHRRMLSDLLTVSGWDVIHLLGPGKSEPHRLWDVARAVEGGLVYDGGAIPLPPE